MKIKNHLSLIAFVIALIIVISKIFTDINMIQTIQDLNELKAKKNTFNSTIAGTENLFLINLVYGFFALLPLTLGYIGIKQSNNLAKLVFAFILLAFLYAVFPTFILA